MALTADQVIVELQAKVDQYNANVVAAEVRFDASMQAIAKNARMAEVATNGAFQRMGSGRGLKATSFQTANIAAQFQDIAVQLQAGQSPFTIALQQGTQLSAALGNQGLRGTLTALLGGFTSLLSPVSLATIAIIGLGGAAVQYFSTLISDGRLSNEELKKQNDIVRDVAKRWGDAVPALQAYVDELDRAQRLQEEQSTAETFKSQTWLDARDAVAALRNDMAGFFDDVADRGGISEEAIAAIRDQWVKFQQDVKNGTATAEQASDLYVAMFAMFRNEGIPSANGLANSFAGLISKILVASQAWNDFQGQTSPSSLADANAKKLDEWVANQDRLNGLTDKQLDLENEIARVKASAKRDTGQDISDAEALRVATANLAAEERRRQEALNGRAGLRAASAYDHEREAVVRLIEDLQAEYDQLGMNAEQKRIANALRQAGAAATDQERQKIVELISATEAERLSIDQAQQQFDELRDGARSAMETIIDGFIDGADAGSVFSSVLRDIGSQLINLGLNSLFGSGKSGDFGLIGKALGFAGGGYTGPGGVYQPAGIVHKGEVVWSQSDIAKAGGVASVEAMRRGLVAPRMPSPSGSGAISTPITIHIDATGADAAGLARVQGQLAQLKAELPGVIKHTVARRAKNGW